MVETVKMLKFSILLVIQDPLFCILKDQFNSRFALFSNNLVNCLKIMQDTLLLCVRV